MNRHQPAHWVGGIPILEPTSHGIPDCTFSTTSLTTESELEADMVHQFNTAALEAAEVTGMMLTSVQVVDEWWERCRANHH